MKRLCFSEQDMAAFIAGRKSLHVVRMNGQPDEHFAGGIPFETGNVDKEIFPPYRPGEIVFIGEWFSTKHMVTDRVLYKDGWEKDRCYEPWIKIEWQSPILMPEELSRFKICIGSVTAKRVHEIMIGDVRKFGYVCEPAIEDSATIMGRHPFVGDWNSRHPGSWGKNEWVWVISLERIN